jgi:hypothetical protein
MRPAERISSSSWSIHPSPPSRATKAREAQVMQLSKSDRVVRTMELSEAASSPRAAAQHPAETDCQTTAPGPQGAGGEVRPSKAAVATRCH